MANKHLERCSTPFVIMKMPIKTSIRVKLKTTHIRIAKVKKKQKGNDVNDGKNAEKLLTEM